MNYGIVSADSHVNEPPDLFKAVPAALRDIAPQLVNTEKGDAWIMAPGAAPRYVSTSAVAGRKKEEYLSRPVTYATMRRGAWEPAPHVEDMDIDHIDVDVLYPGIMRYLERCANDEVRLACARVYNEWIAGFQKHNPQRLVGVATLPPLDADAGAGAIAAMTEARKLGLPTAFLSQNDGGMPLHHPDCDRFWAAAVDLDMPISIHIHTNPFMRAMKPEYRTLMGSGEMGASTVTMAMAEHVAGLIFGGVFMRHPKLKIVFAEGGIGWIPFLLQRMDHVFHVHRTYMGSTITELPSVTWRKNCWATFQEDEPGIRLRDLIGVDRVMWASDYPHTDTTWPESKAVIERDFAGVPEDERRLMVSDTALKLYGLKH